jgi:hypothetical protein
VAPGALSRGKFGVSRRSFRRRRRTPSRRLDGPRQHVDPAARAEVQHFLTLPKFRHAMGYRTCHRPQGPCHEMDITPHKGAKSDLENAQNVLILKWLPHDL